jgi:hypothetical protein
VAEGYESPARPRKRWGRRLLITFIVLLIIVVGVLVVADRLAVSYAERRISDKVSQQITEQKATSAQPDTTIEGVPFLTQVLKGNYQEIKIGIDDFSGPAGNGKTIKMPTLDIDAKDVKAPLDAIRNGTGGIVATTVVGTGTIDYANVESLLGQDGVKLAGKDGKVAVTAPVKILNQAVTVSGTADLTVKDDVVSAHFDQVTAAGLPQVPLVQGLLNGYAKSLSFSFKVPALPLKLAVQKVQPTATGLVVTFGGSNVQLNGGGL